MRIVSSNLIVMLLLTGVAISLIGAGFGQNERPPQPFFQDFFSGGVTLQGSPPPAGTLLIACIDDCQDGFESEPYSLKADGTFDQLEVKPMNKDLVGHTITFYLVNTFGRIKAMEERPYIGVFDFYVQDLTFDDPMPAPPAPSPTPAPEPTQVPTPTASLPIAGDPAVTKFPKTALFTGTIAVVLGGLLLFAARRKVA
ncbi:MAG: hypothetical protein CL902_01850 [Dehalococcoidia bacterium]|nr:hypothetical protein [Dehalococcoidia bacterium]